jgi:exo-1,4-beta-D-glucosaminidase
MMMQLDDGWLLQSAAKVKAPGETVSVHSYAAKGWTPAVVPGTVVGALVKSGTLADPMVGATMESFEGFKGGQDRLHTLMPLPDESPYRKPWWFRNVFRCRRPRAGRRTWLKLEGINYRANVWLNGTRVGTDAHVRGLFKRVPIDITRHLRPGRNCLALEIFAAAPDEFGHTWIDWAPEPPDNSMGILQRVRLRETGSVVIKHPFVQTDLDVRTRKKAALDIRLRLENVGDAPAEVTLEARIGSIAVRRTVTLDRWEEREVVLSAKKHRALAIKNPRLWWPYQLGKPEMYTLALKAKVGRTVSDSAAVPFGIRRITSRLNRHGARVFTVNGRDLLVRGSAWSPDLFLGQSRRKDETDIAYVKNMNLNAIRLEGTPVSDDFWDVCNREGVLVLHGITCVNYWEHTQDWREDDYRFARDSVHSLFSSIRNHPCLMGFMIGSDFPATARVEDMYLTLLEEMPIDVPVTGNSATKHTEQLGPTGMIHGPYDFVPPVFWYQGGATGFNTETGPDVCLPLMETLRKTFPKKGDLKVRSHAWNMHCGLQMYTSTMPGDKALARRYGADEKDLEVFVDASQVMGYECWRAMYEAWVRNYPKSTGVVGWMLNSCWPSLMWQMYDYRNNPLGAFYGTQKACEPLHVQYSYDDHSIWAVNQTPESSGALRVSATVLDLGGAPLWQKTCRRTLSALGRKKCFAVPRTLKLPKVYFLVLGLHRGRKRVSRNVYWLSNHPDRVTIVQKGDQKAMQRPQKAFADFRALGDLPKATIACSTEIKARRSHFRLTTRIANTSEQIAFFLWAKVYSRKTGDLVSPVLWNENCITLLPGERAELAGSVPRMDLKKADLDVRVTGWNTGR